MLYYILGAVAVLVIVLLIVIATRPGIYQVTRTGKVSAPPAAAFEEVNDFHRWSAWSPWEKIDPNLQRTFEGPSSGKGAIYRWQGNKQVGAGNMTITESRPGELVRIRLEFIKPFAALCDTQFAFKPEGNDTAVVWTMNGTNNFMAKAMCLFMNMDKMIGKDFEKGLAQLKAVVEGQKA